MRSTQLLALGLALSWRMQPLAAGELPTQPFHYHEGFEGKDTVAIWATNGKQEVHFKGITDEKAFSGAKSFKLDVTLTDGTYHYWGAPVKAPCAGRLKFSGRIWVEQAGKGSAGLGVNFAFPPTHHSGCGAIDKVRKPTKEWKLMECDLVARGAATADSVVRRYTTGLTGSDVAAFVDRWGLFVYGRAGTRIVLYLDDIKIEGEVPDPGAYKAHGQARWQAARDAFRSQMAQWRADADAALSELDALGELSPMTRRIRETALKAADAAKAQIKRYAKRGYAATWELDELKDKLALVRYAAPNIQDISKLGAAERPYLTYVAKAITNRKLLPTTFPIPARTGSRLDVTACRGEYEPATFAVSALQDVKGLLVTPTDLRGDAGTISASAVDVRVVKCWFQSGRRISETSKRLLTPELLLRDDRLVRVDLGAKHNYLRTGKGSETLISGPDSAVMAQIQPQDAATLQPVGIRGEMTKQFWVTVHVPDDAAAGKYTGRLRLTADGVAASEMALRLRVLPFALEKSPLCYSIYYRGRLHADGLGSVSSEAKSPQQFEAEMRNMHAHGVDYPTVYQGYSEDLLPRVFELRARAGLPRGPLYTLGIGTGCPATPDALARLKAGVEKWLAMAKQHGYDEVYVYGIDEAAGERLKAQRAAWAAVRDAGAKTFVACYKGTFEAMGDLLNVAVLAGPPIREEAEKYHGLGHRAFCYANPQVGEERPETYRRNFGLLLWKAGFDGAMDYAYQHSFGHGWNDFDSKRYRDHNFTYQTVDGVIDTIQWEGFREGVDDVRYLATLLKAIDAANAARPELAARARQWVEQMDVQSDLDALRAEMVKWILKLR